MSGDGSQQLQTAIYTALTTALAPIKVYDHVPEGATYPYVVIGDWESHEFDTDTERGQEHIVPLHTFSRARGKPETRRIQKLIYEALNDVSLTLDAGAALVYLFFDFATVSLDEDGLTYHGVSQFRATTTEA